MNNTMKITLRHNNNKRENHTLFQSYEYSFEDGNHWKEEIFCYAIVYYEESTGDTWDILFFHPRISKKESKYISF